MRTLLTCVVILLAVPVGAQAPAPNLLQLQRDAEQTVADSEKALAAAAPAAYQAFVSAVKNRATVRAFIEAQANLPPAAPATEKAK